MYAKRGEQSDSTLFLEPSGQSLGRFLRVFQIFRAVGDLRRETVVCLCAFALALLLLRATGARLTVLFGTTIDSKAVLILQSAFLDHQQQPVPLHYSARLPLHHSHLSGEVVMPKIRPIPCPPGLEGDDACRIIRRYWRHISEFLTEHVIPRHPDPTIDPIKQHQLLLEPFNALRDSIIPPYAKDPKLHAQGLALWRDIFMLPLAQRLGLAQQVERTVIKRCVRRGQLVWQVDGKGNLDQLLEKQLIPRVRRVFQRYPYRTGKQSYLQPLVKAGLCPDEEMAETFGHAYKQIDDRAAALAQGTMLAFMQYSLIGLLKYTDYPAVEELLMLERYRDDIAERNARPDWLIGVLRKDILAIRATLVDIDASGTFWNSGLLELPPYNELRQQYQHRLTPELKAQFIELLPSKRGCGSEEAKTLAEIFVASGLPGMIDWRTGATEQLQDTIEDRRLRRRLHRHLEAVDGADLQRIEELLGHLKAAIHETHIGISLPRLLGDSPFSPKRKRFGRGLWFGVSTTQKRHQRFKRRPRRGVMVPQTRIRLIEDEEPDTVLVGSAPEDALVTAFARRADLTEPQARDVIRNLGIYAGLGMLLKSEWSTALDPDIVEYIQFIKLGHIDGTVRITALQEVVNAYAQSLVLPDFSLQIVKSVFYALRKDRRWNGGESSIMAGIRQQATLVLDTPRLHQTWLIICITLPLALRDERTGRNSDESYLLVVLERATERPMGGWLSATPPGEAEIGLAVYQAIWHPWVPNWPFRGIPERIVVPAGLANGGLVDLKRASRFLLTVVDDSQATVWESPRPKKVVKDKTSKDPKPTDDLDPVRRIEREGSAIVREEYRGRNPTWREAQQALMSWLSSEEWFPKHTFKDIPEGWHLTLPGFRSPAAGWLLPRTGQVQLDRAGILDRRVRYESALFQDETNQVLWKREFPSFYPGFEAGIFVESSDGSMLRYVTRAEVKK